MTAQQALTNDLKHAQATQNTLHLSAAADQLTLPSPTTAKASPPPPKPTANGHFGCMGIRERCRKTGADVEWQKPAI